MPVAEIHTDGQSAIFAEESGEEFRRNQGAQLPQFLLTAGFDNDKSRARKWYTSTCHAAAVGPTEQAIRRPGPQVDYLILLVCIARSVQCAQP